ncbi:MAG: ferrochelatase [Chloroflexi bacterium]|nr:ferrochelatase [Chloroflexota bacterium]
MNVSDPRIGLLVAQLGTPDAPTAKALRPYLKQFLSDMRVIDYSPFLWQPLLRGVILLTRPRRSARLYARIWLKEGSPLLVYSQAQAAGLQARLGARFRVILGMTYGNPSIAAALDTLEQEGIDRIIVLPMFPQFSSTTTASIYDAVYRAAAGRRCPLFHERKRFVPTLRFIEPYYDHPGYIDALRAHLTAQAQNLPQPPDKFVITFHGIPRRYVAGGDPYRQQCERTAQLLARAMGWSDEQWLLCFQSRFGPEKWLEPYTQDVLTGLHQQGVMRPLVFSPGFVTDCLETLDELGNEGREQFEQGGGHGAHYTLAPCLNADELFLDTLAEIVQSSAGGWVQAQAMRAASG